MNLVTFATLQRKRKFVSEMSIGTSRARFQWGPRTAAHPFVISGAEFLLEPMITNCHC